MRTNCEDMLFCITELYIQELKASASIKCNIMRAFDSKEMCAEIAQLRYTLDCIKNTIGLIPLLICNKGC